jgi:hypothetical protein
LVALVPVKEMLMPVSVVVPRFCSVTVRAELVVLIRWFPNEMLAGVTETDTPVPDRTTVCGLPVASSVIEIEAERAPLAVGLKVTLIVQFEPPASVAPQVVVRAKSPALVPVIVMLLIARAAPPVLESVILLALLVVFTP